MSDLEISMTHDSTTWWFSQRLKTFMRNVTTEMSFGSIPSDGGTCKRGATLCLVVNP